MLLFVRKGTKYNNNNQRKTKEKQLIVSCFWFLFTIGR